MLTSARLAGRLVGLSRGTPTASSAAAAAASGAATSKLSASSGRPASGREDGGGGLEQVGPAQAAKDQNAQAGDTDYNATPAYPNQTPDDAGSGDAAMAASRAPHPSGPTDTSSVNDPAGRAEGRYHEQAGSQHSMHVHHPGRESDVAAAGMAQGRPSNQQQQQQTQPEQPPRIDAPGSAGSSAEGIGALDAGVESSNVVAGSARAMTADFAAGGDDVDPPGGHKQPGGAAASAHINPDTGLPRMAAAAGAGSARFGALKNPGDVGDQGQTARQTEKSTGMEPGKLGSS